MLDRIIVQNNPVNWVDPYGLFYQGALNWVLTRLPAINDAIVFVIEDIQTGAYGYVDFAQDSANWLYQNTKDFRGFDPGVIYRSEEMLNDILVDMWEVYWERHGIHPPPNACEN